LKKTSGNKVRPIKANQQYISFYFIPRFVRRVSPDDDDDDEEEEEEGVFKGRGVKEVDSRARRRDGGGLRRLLHFGACSGEHIQYRRTHSIWKNTFHKECVPRLAH
jgi:hypothetical protein